MNRDEFKALLRRYIPTANRSGYYEGGTPVLALPSGAEAKVFIERQADRSVVVMVQPCYEPSVRETHVAEVERIKREVAALVATIPVRFGRPLATVRVSFQGSEGSAQYTLTREDADWINAAIASVCPVVERWVGRGGEWCLSHRVDPTAMLPE